MPRIAAMRWLACLLITMTVIAHAATDVATAEMLVQKSGLSEQMGLVVPQFRAGLAAGREREAQEGRIPEAQWQRILAAVDAVYAPESLRAIVVAVVAQETDPKHLPALTAWLSSPVAARVVAREKAVAAMPVGPVQMMQEAVASFDDLPEARRRYMESLAGALRLDDAMVTLAINLSVALITGIAAADASLDSGAPAEVRRRLEAQRPAIRRKYASIVPALTAVTYGSLADEDLAAYRAFVESEAGRHFVDVQMRAIQRALGEGTRAFGERLPAMLGRVTS